MVENTEVGNSQEMSASVEESNPVEESVQKFRKATRVKRLPGEAKQESRGESSRSTVEPTKVDVSKAVLNQG